VTPMNDDTAILSALPAGQMPEAEPEDESRDGLAEELAHAAPKRWWNRGTVVLAGLVLLAGGFVGGVQVQKNWGATPARNSGFPAGGFAAGANGANGAGRYGGGAARGGTFGGGGTQGGGTGAQGGNGTAAAPAATTGTVKLVDGTTIYVQTADGSLVTVNTSGKTTVSSASKSTIKSVKAGQKVTVQGATGSDGSVTATSVTTQK
jgi:hypothetical protein